jgi:hypothetical protein
LLLFTFSPPILTCWIYRLFIYVSHARDTQFLICLHPFSCSQLNHTLFGFQETTEKTKERWDKMRDLQVSEAAF